MNTLLYKPILFTLDEAADILRVSQRTLHRERKEGRLPAKSADLLLLTAIFDEYLIRTMAGRPSSDSRPVRWI